MEPLRGLAPLSAVYKTAALLDELKRQLAALTGLDPVPTPVTGEESTLKYRALRWSFLQDLHPRTAPCKGDALLLS